MTYYPQFPTFYAFPVPCPGPEFYSMYPFGMPVAGTNMMLHDQQQMDHFQPYFRPNRKSFELRKISNDSGIYSSSNASSRKTSNTSTTSATSVGEESIMDEEVFEKPDDYLATEIAQQVEFYFDNANLLEDKFLLKHVRRNKEGFVSIKLITSFKRVKHLTKDWRQVAYAIEMKSSKLEVNDLKTKVRRIQPLPDLGDIIPSRVVGAFNWPLDSPTVESVAEVFSPYGEILSIRIHRPTSSLPEEFHYFRSKYRDMTNKVWALVEFDQMESVMEAVKCLNNDEEGQFKVRQVSYQNKKTFEKQKPPPSIEQPERRYSQPMAPYVPYDPQQPNPIQGGQRRKISVIHNTKFVPIFEEKLKLNPEMAYRPGRRSAGELPNPNGGGGFPINVIRQPRGPDMKEEFSSWCRDRMLERSSSASDVKALEVQQDFQTMSTMDENSLRLVDNLMQSEEVYEKTC